MIRPMKTTSSMALPALFFDAGLSACFRPVRAGTIQPLVTDMEGKPVPDMVAFVESARPVAALNGTPRRRRS